MELYQLYCHTTLICMKQITQTSPYMECRYGYSFTTAPAAIADCKSCNKELIVQNHNWTMDLSHWTVYYYYTSLLEGKASGRELFPFNSKSMVFIFLSRHSLVLTYSSCVVHVCTYSEAWGSVTFWWHSCACNCSMFCMCTQSGLPHNVVHSSSNVCNNYSWQNLYLSMSTPKTTYGPLHCRLYRTHITSLT